MLTLRNLCLAILLSLPFTKSLTLPIGFALKPYELLIPVALVAALRHGPIDLGPYARWVRVWLVFLFLSLFPTAWGYTLILERDTASLEWAVGRYDPLINILFHTVYLALNVAALTVFLTAFRRRDLTVLDFTRWWTWGALAAVGYSVYANLVFRAGLPLALTLRWSEPQTARVGGIEFVRSGPFEEGNYFGLYLVLSLVVALWGGSRSGARFYYWSLPALVLGIFLSASPAALVMMLVILTLSLGHPATPRPFKFIQVALMVSVVAIVLTTNLFQEMVLDKFSIVLFGGITNSGNISLMQRVNEAVHAWRTFVDHPFGVGIGNFAFFWGDHPEFFTELEVPYNSVKQIPNMVYLEILTEQGFLGLLLFLYAMGSMTAGLLVRRQWVLGLGVAAMLGYFVVFPTFRLVFLWAFWAFLLAAPRASEPTR